MSSMVGRTIYNLLLASVALMATASLANAQGRKELAKDPYKDTRWGFEVTMFSKWTPIPAQPNARYEIGRFTAPAAVYEAKTGMGHLPMVRVYRFDPKGKSSAPMQQGKPAGGQDGPSTGDDGRKEEDQEIDKLSLRNTDEFLNNKKGAQRQGKPEKIKIGNMEATVNRYQSGTQTKVMTKHYAVTFDAADGSQILLDYEMPDFEFDDWKDLFTQSAKTFRFIDKVSSDPSALAGLTPVERDRVLHKEDVARTPGWKFDETPHFFIKYDIDNANFIKELKERIEAIRKVFVTRFGDKEMTELPVCRVTKTIDEYYKYGGPRGSGGYWNDKTKELVIPCLKEMDIKWTWAVMNHEAFHQFIYYFYGKVDPHSWYNEGTGDYYSGFKYEGNGKFEIKTVGAWMALLDRLGTIKEAIKKNEYVPLEKIFRYSQQQYYNNPDVCYAEGWSIVYFLMEGKKLGAKGWKPEYERILDDYLSVLLKSKDTSKAIEYALKDFKGDQMKELEETWKAFTLKLR